MGYLNDRFDDVVGRLNENWNDVENDIREVAGNTHVSGLVGLAREMSQENIQRSLNFSIHGDLDILNSVCQGLLEFDYAKLEVALRSLSDGDFLNSINQFSDTNMSALFMNATRLNFATVDRIIKSKITNVITKWCKSVPAEELGIALVTYPAQPYWLPEMITATLNDSVAQKRLTEAALNAYNSIGIPSPDTVTRAFVRMSSQAREKFLSNIGSNNIVKMLSQYGQLDAAGKLIITETLSSFADELVSDLARILSDVFNNSVSDFKDLVRSLSNYDRIGRLILHLPEDVHDTFIHTISSVDLGKILGTLSPPYMEGPMSKLCVRGGTFDTDCFINKTKGLISSLSAVTGDITAQFTTPGHVTVNLLTGSYDIDVKLGLGELFLTRRANIIPSCDIGDWYDFCSSLYEVTIEVDDYEYYRQRQEWYEKSRYYSHYSSKRWVNYFSVSEAISATAWAIVSQGASVEETIERTSQVVYLELEDILVWLTSFDTTAMIDYVFPQLVRTLASGAQGCQMQHYAFRPTGVNYYHSLKKPFHNLLHAILQNWRKDIRFETWAIADRHCSYCMQSGIPLPDDRAAVYKRALERILSVYQSGTNNNRELVGDFFNRHGGLEQEITNMIAQRIGVEIPTHFQRFEDYRDQMEDARELHSIISPDSLSEADIQSIYDSYEGLSPVIDLSESALADRLKSKLDFMAMGNEGEAKVKRLELNVLTALLSAEVELLHRNKFNL
tara:strand:- start:795 stop:2984 length:2190 start_codon:yes stop_codon:yes gene_type:complete